MYMYFQLFLDCIIFLYHIPQTGKKTKTKKQFLLGLQWINCISISIENITSIYDHFKLQMSTRNQLNP